MLPVPYAARIAALEAICQVISYSIADGSDHSRFRVGREVVGFALLRDLDPALGMRSSHSCASNALDSGRAEARTLPIPGLNHRVCVMVVD